MATSYDYGLNKRGAHKAKGFVLQGVVQQVHVKALNKLSERSLYPYSTSEFEMKVVSPGAVLSYGVKCPQQTTMCYYQRIYNKTILAPYLTTPKNQEVPVPPVLTRGPNRRPALSPPKFTGYKPPARKQHLSADSQPQQPPPSVYTHLGSGNRPSMSANIQNQVLASNTCLQDKLMNLRNVKEGDRLGFQISADGILQFFYNGKSEGIAADRLFQKYTSIHPFILVEKGDICIIRAGQRNLT